MSTLKVVNINIRKRINMKLSCGEGGSTGAEVIGQINANTKAIEESGLVNIFPFSTEQNKMDIQDTLTEVARLDVFSLPAGVYMVGISHTHTFTETNKSVLYTITLNNGTPEEFSIESKDATDRHGKCYMFPLVQKAPSQVSVSLKFAKEDAAGTLDVLFANIWIDWKDAYRPPTP